MSEVTPRLWFLPPVERWGSFRVGFGVGLGLLVVNLGAALVLGGVAQLEIRFAVNYSLGVGYSLAVGCAALTSLRQGIDGRESTGSAHAARVWRRQSVSRLPPHLPFSRQRRCR